MGKKSKQSAKVENDASRRVAPSSFALKASIAAAIVACVLAVWWSNFAGSATIPALAPKSPTDDALEGLGPKTMQAQQPLVNRLLELLEEIDQLKGDDNQAERQQASLRVAKELEDIEATLGGKNAVDKQSAALISVVRSAMDADKGGWKEEDWNDETLAKQHGFVTYASQAYWDEAYADNKYGESFDWYGAWSENGTSGQTLGDNVRPLVAKDAGILMLGCGNSNMSVLMHEEGYQNITNVDISEPVITRMQNSYGHIHGLSWLAMDASALTFADGSFDTVIEKGLFDALFAGTGVLAHSVISELQRVLRPGGSLISITFSGQRLTEMFHDGGNDGLRCELNGEIQYQKAKSTHHEKGDSQVFEVYRCRRS